MPSIRYTACQFLPHSCASRLAATTLRTLVDVGIAVRLPTKRGCRGGGRKQRTINPVIGHRPPTDRPHTRRINNNLIQVPTVTQDSTVLVDKAKLCLINARSLRNKSLFVRSYVDECSLDIVALTETWLTDEDTTSFSELCRDSFILIHQSRGGARRGGGIGVLFRENSPARIPCQCRHPRLRNTPRHSTKCPYQLHNACNCDIPTTELVFWNISGRRVYGVTDRRYSPHRNGCVRGF